MSQLLLIVSLFILLFSFLMTAYRLYKGPNGIDRVASFDLIMVSSAVLLMITGLLTQSEFQIEAAGFVVVMSFFGTLALAAYLDEEKS